MEEEVADFNLEQDSDFGRYDENEKELFENDQSDYQSVMGESLSSDVLSNKMREVKSEQPQMTFLGASKDFDQNANSVGILMQTKAIGTGKNLILKT